VPLNAGHLDRRVTLRARAAGVDSRGQPDGAWADVDTVWAQPMPSKGREYFAADTMQAETAMAWRIRYRTDVTAAMQLVDDDGTPYDIQAAVPAANREWLDLYALAGIKDGRP